MEHNNEVKKDINRKAIERHRDFTSFKKSRRTLMKLFCAADHYQLEKEDEEEIFLLYNLLEELE